jgi:hypothetical protein
MNCCKSTEQFFDTDKMVAQVDCTLVVHGYTDPRVPGDF